LARPSTTPVPVLSQRAWTQQLVDMLRACGQDSLATEVESGGLSSTCGPLPNRSIAGDPDRLESGSWTTLTARARKAAAGFRSRGRAALGTLERKLTENDWTHHVQRLVQCEPILRAVIVGPSMLSRGQRALRRAVRMSPWLPQIMEIRHSAANGRRLGKGFAGRDFTPGDLVYITTNGAVFGDLSSVCDRADIIMIEGINRTGGGQLADLLSRNNDFSIALHNTYQQGYAIFRRRKSGLAWNGGLLAERLNTAGIQSEDASF
jgi:hypothetical protein